MGHSPSAITATAGAASADMQGAAGNTRQSCPRVTLEIGVFFDGTMNNAANAIAGGSGASYNNARSNVSLLYDLYKDGPRFTETNSCGTPAKKYAAIYKEGIGTTTGQADWRPGNKTGAINGMGRTGIEARVHEACLDVGNKIRMLSPGIEPQEIVMDVFGFSRGAAAARYFVNCFRQGFVEYYVNYVSLRRASLPPGRTVRFRFVGVFDTVAAVGWGTDDDNGPVNVHMSTAQATRIYHLTARHEYRENFRLNHNIPGGGDTREMLGAHSDVGGGYRDPGDEVVVDPTRVHSFPNRVLAERARTAAVTRANAARASQESFFIREGWILPNEPTGGLLNTPTPLVSRAAGGVMGIGRQVWTYRTGARLSRPWVQVGLSRIPLRLMYDQARASQVPFRPFPTSREYTVPPALAAMTQTSLTPGGNMRRQILRNYGHMSSNFGSIGMSPDTGFRRVIYPNIPGQAK